MTAILLSAGSAPMNNDKLIDISENIYIKQIILQLILELCEGKFWKNVKLRLPYLNKIVLFLRQGSFV